MSIVIVTGVPGVGKSTVMNSAKDFGYNIVNFGTTMFEEGKKEGVSSRDDLRNCLLMFKKGCKNKLVKKLVKWIM